MSSDGHHRGMGTRAKTLGRKGFLSSGTLASCEAGVITAYPGHGPEREHDAQHVESVQLSSLRNHDYSMLVEPPSSDGQNLKCHRGNLVQPSARSLRHPHTSAKPLITPSLDRSSPDQWLAHSCTKLFGLPHRNIILLRYWTLYIGRTLPGRRL